jgi:hypothetical protein
LVRDVISNNRWNIDENQSKVNDRMRKHLLIAGLILALEAWLGIGLFGMPVGFVCVVVFVILAVSEKQQRSQKFKVAAVYALLFVATLVLLLSTVRVAQSRATPVISAVNRYHSEHGHYPQALGELVPAYLTSVPHAGFTRISRNFYYYNGRPQLYFAAMFHGVFAFDFPTQTWRTNE